MRSLAEDVRARSDEELAALLVARPDLARPMPADLTALAARASTTASVQRAIDHLDRPRLEVLEAALISGSPIDLPAIVGLTGQSPDAVEAAADHLRFLALLWTSPEGRHVVRAAGDVLGPHIAGLGPSAADVSRRGAPSATEVDDLLASAPAAAKTVLDRLTWGPPIAAAPADPASAAAAAVTWLVDAGLLVRLDEGRVVLPREVALALRGGRLHRGSVARPEIAVRQWEADDVDRAAGWQASDLVALVAELLSTWEALPPRVLRSGGLAVRDLKGVAAALDVDESRAAFLVEIAHGAGLLDDDRALEPSWQPTIAADAWFDETPAHRWSALALAWTTSIRAPHRVGASSGSGPINALGADVQWPPIRSLRHDVLDVLADLPAGAAVDAAGVVERLRHDRPRRLPREPERVVSAILGEAEWLGLTGRGALSSAGRSLLAGDDADPVTVMSAHMPEAVDHVLLQADLTAIAPGPLTGELARTMRLLSDVESRGGATVHRFSEGSIRRGLDTGLSADDIAALLADASRTPVPQPLDYLVRDVARRHGQLRIGAVGSYVRGDDEAGLDRVMAERNLSHLQLRRIAPTVLVSAASPTVLLEALREVGLAPVLESSTGGVVVPTRSRQRVTGGPTPAPASVNRVDEDSAVELVVHLRQRDEAMTRDQERRATQAGPSIPATDPTTTLAVLREAIADRQGVWVGYSNSLGQVARILFHPERIEGGRAHGTVDGAPRTLSVHRVTGVTAD
ncbi:helicase-associated domain-containing protein [Janibacter sp. G56]|uniref:helicase-associated domain-containing protein n=1 Tax=Janibacter sp. G56 TaxID=3418717 RepID=UPI003CFD656C